MAEAFLESADAKGTGRRKSSVARVRVRPGDGQILVNRRPLEEYFPLTQDRNNVMVALEKTEKVGEVNLLINVTGGGASGQSGACKMGIARALIQYDAELEPILREHNLLTRDSRMKERKKYGLRGARKGTQFSKR